MSEMIPTSRNLPEVVYAFLGDRRCQQLGVQQALGPLYSQPDFTSAIENHLRASALFACKDVAWPAMLGLFLRPIRRLREGIAFDSIFDWAEKTLSPEELESNRAQNIWLQPIWHSVAEALAGRELACPKTAKHIAITQKKCPASAPCLPIGPTIWRMVEEGALMCVEGNRRFHALALSVQRGYTQHDPSYPIWVGTPREDAPQEWVRTVPVAGDEWIIS